MSAPDTSVVMPVFNGMATLPRAVASIRNQSLSSWELVAVDDGSTDGTGEWLEHEAEADPRVRVFRRSHAGIVGALNAGLAAARGAFIARMDADDVSLPDRLARQRSFLDAHPEIGVVGCLVRFGGERTASEGYALHVDWLNSVVTSGEIDVARFIEAPFAHPSVLFRAELVGRFGGYRDGEFPEDYELWLRWLEAGVRMAKVGESLLEWHDGPQRLSRVDARYTPEAFFRLKAEYLARWLRQNNHDDRPLLVWGAGRVTRRRVELVEREGIRIDGFIDVDPRKQRRLPDGRRVRAPAEIPGPAEAFVLGFVARRGAREWHREVLVARGGVEGRDFVFAA